MIRLTGTNTPLNFLAAYGRIWKIMLKFRMPERTVEMSSMTATVHFMKEIL